MSKKSLIASLVMGAIATLSLGVYTLVATIIALTTPHYNVVSLAYTDKVLKNGEFVKTQITAFSDYSEDAGNLTIKYNEGEEAFLNYDAEAKAYTVKDDAFDGAGAVSPRHFEAVATTDKYGSTTTYKVDVYHQGDGSATDPYIVANGEGLAGLAEDVNKGTDGGSLLNDKNIELVADVDLSGVDFEPIGNGRNPFKGTFEGNGKVVKNLNLIVTKDNYQDYVTYDERVGQEKYMLDLGLFGMTYQANINAVSIENAKISVADDLEEIFSEDITVGENTAALARTRAGLLVATVLDSEINGEYVAKTWEEEVVDGEGNPVLDGEGNPQTETKTEKANAVVSGTISGLMHFNATIQTNEGLYNAFGGLVGHEFNQSSTQSITTANYKVNVTINTSGVMTNNSQNYKYVGGVVGVATSALGQHVNFEKIEVNFVASTQFNAQNYIGGFAGYLVNSTVSNSTINAKVSDANGTTIDDFVAAAQTAGFDKKLSLVGGVARRAFRSEFTNVEVVADLDLWTKVSGGFNVVENSTLTNVTVAGQLNGFYANGLAHTVNNSTIAYTNTEETELVAADVKLSAHNAVALVDYLNNTSITATGAVRVNSEINAYGYVVQPAAVYTNNVSHSSGLVGYFYTTNTDTGATYKVSGLTVNTTINDGLDMAGVATYLGTQGSYATVALEDIKVESVNLNSYSEANYSSTHKAAGAVATIYGNAKVKNVEVADIEFNKEHASGKYGAAMFGGLVARIGGTNVELDGNKTTGYAYINYSLYKKTFGDRTFTQLLAGGLVGAVADFEISSLTPGTHPVYEEGESEVFEAGETRDNMSALSMAYITLKNNNANVDLVVDYADDYEGQESKYMYEDGYRARALGSLVGLINNTSASYTNLGTNVASGTIVADDATFRFEHDSAIRSCKGDGAISSDHVAYDPAKIVGCTSDLVSNGDYSTSWAMPTIADKPEVAE